VITLETGGRGGIQMKVLCGTVAVLILVGSGVMVYVLASRNDVRSGSTDTGSSPFRSVGPLEESKRTRARLDAMALGEQAEIFNIKHGRYPVTLGELAMAVDGMNAQVPDDKLVDPWGKRYQFDPAGPRNRGARPDIWTTAPDGSVIGNWPEKK
jgi:hypothetical protein